jgi:hypothetical protein
LFSGASTLSFSFLSSSSVEVYIDHVNFNPGAQSKYCSLKVILAGFFSLMGFLPFPALESSVDSLCVRPSFSLHNTWLSEGFFRKVKAPCAYAVEGA